MLYGLHDVTRCQASASCFHTFLAALFIRHARGTVQLVHSRMGVNGVPRIGTGQWVRGQSLRSCCSALQTLNVKFCALGPTPEEEPVVFFRASIDILKPKAPCLCVSCSWGRADRCS